MLSDPQFVNQVVIEEIWFQRVKTSLSIVINSEENTVYDRMAIPHGCSSHFIPKMRNRRRIVKLEWVCHVHAPQDNNLNEENNTKFISSFHASFLSKTLAKLTESTD